MRDDIRVNGWDFEFVSQDDGKDQFYQCRGEVMYDDDHDEMPEPSLWQAAEKLEKQLEDKVLNARQVTLKKVGLK
jgi:hypothetical protein